jgi:hypothetical protein
VEKRAYKEGDLATLVCVMIEKRFGEWNISTSLNPTKVEKIAYKEED